MVVFGKLQQRIRSNCEPKVGVEATRYWLRYFAWLWLSVGAGALMLASAVLYGSARSGGLLVLFILFLALLLVCFAMMNWARARYVGSVAEYLDIDRHSAKRAPLDARFDGWLRAQRARTDAESSSESAA